MTTSPSPSARSRSCWPSTRPCAGGTWCGKTRPSNSVWKATKPGPGSKRPAREIALHTGLAEQSVHNLVSRYNRLGPEAVAGPGKGGRRRSYLSWDEEAALLESYKQVALTGQIATAAEIKGALERRIGHKVHKTMVYRLLKRHGWRKLVPQPFHVDADKQEQEAFKKTS
ncbi:MAG TPA: hypothetical protein DCY27_10330 [Desulfobacterales bacterium]|nr:hypothetical protein [Desulfobacterales bacterium]